MLIAAIGAAAALPLVDAAAPAGSPARPGPAVPSGLPQAIEEPASYLQQVSCDPQAKPGSVKLGNLLRATYRGTSYSVGRDCGADGMASEHYEGRAVDWFVSVRKPTQAAQAQEVVNWLLAPDAAGRPYANARRLGIMYMIWNDRIWGSYRAGEGWRPYGSCASRPGAAYDTTCHRDHIHFSLSWAGAMGRTSFWSKTVAPADYGPCRPADLNWAPAVSGPRAKPCPSYFPVGVPSGASPTLAALVRYSGATVSSGSRGPVVRALQAGLGLGVDGAYGAQTAAAVSSLQRSAGLRASGRMDAETWRALLARAGSSPAGKPPSTSSGPSSGGGASSGGSGAGSSSAPSPAAVELQRYAGTFLRPGSRGAAVLALQKALSVPGANGYFGPATTKAVIAFQKAHRLTPDGLVGPATWKALTAAAGRAATTQAPKTASATPSANPRPNPRPHRRRSRPARRTCARMPGPSCDPAPGALRSWPCRRLCRCPAPTATSDRPPPRR